MKVRMGYVHMREERSLVVVCESCGESFRSYVRRRKVFAENLRKEKWNVNRWGWICGKCDTPENQPPLGGGQPK